MTVAISIERFLGICYPLHLPPKNRKSWFYIVPVIILSVLVNLPKFFEAEIEWLKEYDEGNTSMVLNNTVGHSYEELPRHVPAYRPTDLRKDSNYIKGSNNNIDGWR